MNLELTAEECELLREVLESEVHKIEVEINRTDSFEFKNQLRHRASLLEGLARKTGSHDPLVQS